MTFTKEPLRKYQPLRRDQKSRPQCGHYSEVLLYYYYYCCCCCCCYCYYCCHYIIHLFIHSLFVEEQFYRYLCLSNERVTKYRIRMIAHLESHFKDLEVMLHLFEFKCCFIVCLFQKLPSEEEKEQLGKGLLEVLHLPKEPS